MDFITEQDAIEDSKKAESSSSSGTSISYYRLAHTDEKTYSMHDASGVIGFRQNKKGHLVMTALRPIEEPKRMYI
jgi:hypothetical protein